MSQVLVNFRMDAEDKKGMEDVCKELGMSMSTAFNIFAKKCAGSAEFLLMYPSIRFTLTRILRIWNVSLPKLTRAKRS